MKCVRWCVLAFSAAMWLGLIGTAQAQSTAFTYQGSLKNNALPADGLHDFRFRLYDAAAGGNQLGTTQCLDDVVVKGGAFTATIDFGPQFVASGPRFLEIDVRKDIGQPCTDVFGYVLLAPRQLLTPTPTAMHAKSAFGLAASDGSPASAVIVDATGRVGVGAATPASMLHAQGDAAALRLQDDGSPTSFLIMEDTHPLQARLNKVTGAGQTLLDINPMPMDGTSNANVRFFRETNTTGSKSILFHTGLNSAATSAVIGVGGASSFFQFDGGNFGIGTSTPAAKLHVAGGAIIQNNVSIGTDTAKGMLTVDGKIFVGKSSANGAIEVDVPTVVGGGVGLNSVVGSANSTFCVGVRGEVKTSEVNSFGVLCVGRFGATGTKSFRIDHPEYPQTHYLLHYSTESNEAINFYRGTVTLDDEGRARVKLPSYFAKINKDPSYQLTAIGAAMPGLHVAKEISAAALDEGASQAAGVPGPTCVFTIAGGTAGGKVSWRVEALRNDAFIREGGAPSEVVKPPSEQGGVNTALSMQTK